MDGPDPLAEAFVRRGYAWLNVDARGSGASFGSRPYPWAEAETRDGAEIVDWIISQPWSNEKVGTFGTSYNGTTAEFLVVNGHPAVVAAAPRFSLFDAYHDISHPGGLHLRWFTSRWSAFNAALDRNEIPSHLREMLGWRALVVGGVRPVDGPDGPALVEAAVEDHASNWDVATMAEGITYRDDGDDQGRTSDVFSPFRYAAELTPPGRPSGAGAAGSTGATPTRRSSATSPSATLPIA